MLIFDTIPAARHRRAARAGARAAPAPRRRAHALLTVDFDPGRLQAALGTLQPRAVVLTGRGASLDVLGRVVYAARRSGTGVGVFDFRDALPEGGSSTVPRLGRSALAARDELTAHLDGRAANRAALSRTAGAS